MLPPWWAVVLFFGLLLAFALFVRKQDELWFEPLASSPLKSRVAGVVLVAFSLLAAYVLVYGPIRDAMAQQRMISVPRGAAGLSGLFLGFSLLFLVAGSKVPTFMVTRLGQTPTVFQQATTIGLVLLGLLLEFGLHRGFQALGYSARW